MKTIIWVLLCLTTLGFGKTISNEPCGCIEGIEQEIKSLVFGDSIKKSASTLKSEVKKVLDENCPEEVKKRIIINNSQDIQECINNLESEIMSIIAQSQNDNQEVDVEIFINNINKKFNDCKEKTNCAK